MRMEIGGWLAAPPRGIFGPLTRLPISLSVMTFERPQTGPVDSIYMYAIGDWIWGGEGAGGPSLGHILISITSSASQMWVLVADPSFYVFGFGLF